MGLPDKGERVKEKTVILYLPFTRQLTPYLK